VVETSVSTTTWTSADVNSEQDLQGSSVTSEEAQTDCIASVNKVVQQLISRIIVIIKILNPYRKAPTPSIPRSGYQLAVCKLQFPSATVTNCFYTSAGLFSVTLSSPNYDLVPRFHALSYLVHPLTNLRRLISAESIFCWLLSTNIHVSLSCINVGTVSQNRL
jgi:hypothetical protein